MFDIGMTELLVIGVTALIVVGPKDLPGMFRALGRFMGKARAMGREFQRAMEDAADESGVRDAANELKGLSNPKRYGIDKLNEAADAFEKWDPMTSPAKPGPATKAMAEDRAARTESAKAAAAERAAARDADPVPSDGPAKTTGTAAASPLTSGDTSE
ncbi:Sec-independent protein translocase protein TatB [Palleronia caenipelagi]|uniref:Sec-independent protein translocase protein TatB n=1 Tax=Palleronia caenipelagi TaxID=2489174 RepID=A0A547Q9F4_9RHOB|nr:Sec-independent protein translocase protein TatB [Palleronia caenipelagi]TRD23029.1 twin-arginine translocase subunit TatB [Palleronia caenipelagi]